MLALRVDLAGDPTVAELLGRVRDVTLEAYAHAELPFEALVEGLHLPRDPAGRRSSRRCSSCSGALPSWRLPGVRSRPAADPGKHVEVRSARGGARSDGGLQLDLEYNTDLFDRSTIDRLTDRLATILDAFTTGTATPISGLPLISDDERQLVVTTWNDTAHDYPRNASIHELFVGGSRGDGRTRSR